ncbi:MAG: MarR family winged helix-turn-helix transcriptional regulator [Acidimicrobiales bacterium]
MSSNPSQVTEREQGASELERYPWHRVESTLMATARCIRTAYDSAFAVLDLNLTSASLLMYVVEQGGTSQTALADVVDVGRAAAGAIVDRLSDRGLVERRADEQDRRVWLVEATADGKEMAGRISAIDRQVGGQLRNGIDRSERQLLASVLLRMQTNLLGDEHHRTHTSEQS